MAQRNFSCNKKARRIAVSKKAARVSPHAPPAPKLCPEYFKSATVSTEKVVPKMAEHNDCGFDLPAWKDTKLSDDIERISIDVDKHRHKLGEIEIYFKNCMKRSYPDAKVWTVGSYPAGVDIRDSDLDFTLTIPCLNESKFSKLMAIRAQFQRTEEFVNPWVVKGWNPVLKMKHKESDIWLDVTINNDAPKRNTMLLARYSQVDERFAKLCRAIKRWAAETGVENSRNGRLNSCSICLLVIFYLQKMGVLPNLQNVFPELNGNIEVDSDDYQQENILDDLRKAGWVVGKNKSSLGALFCGFLKFYSKFDFSSKWISIKRGMALDKFDENGNKNEGLPDDVRFIVLEDPFMDTPFNCGRTVFQADILERIQLEFCLAVKRIKATHQISEEKSVTRTQIDTDGIEGDKKTIEIERDICYGTWDLDLPRREDREWPQRFYDPVVEIEREPWPKVIPKVRCFYDVADSLF
ncbi:unnamed protein product [Caenorhabditis brenneri]